MRSTRCLGATAALVLALLAGGGAAQAQQDAATAPETEPSAATTAPLAVTCVYPAYPRDMVCEQAMASAVAERLNARLDEGIGISLGEIDDSNDQQRFVMGQDQNDPVTIRVEGLEGAPLGADCEARYKALLGVNIPVFETGTPPDIQAAAGPWNREAGIVPLCLRLPACPEVEAAPDHCPSARSDETALPPQPPTKPQPSGLDQTGEESALSGARESGDETPRQPEATAPKPPPSDTGYPIGIAIAAFMAIVVAMLTAIGLIVMSRKQGNTISHLENEIDHCNRSFKQLSNAMARLQNRLDEVRPDPNDLHETLHAVSARVSRIETDMRGFAERSATDGVRSDFSGVSRPRSGIRDAPAAAAAPSREDRPYGPVDRHPDLHSLQREMIEVFQGHMARRGGDPEPFVSFDWHHAGLARDGRILNQSATGARIWIVPSDPRDSHALAMPDPTWIRDKQSMLRNSPINVIENLLGTAFDISQRADAEETFELVRPARLRRGPDGLWKVSERGDLAYRPA